VITWRLFLAPLLHSDVAIWWSHSLQKMEGAEKDPLLAPPQYQAATAPPQQQQQYSYPPAGTYAPPAGTVVYQPQPQMFVVSFGDSPMVTSPSTQDQSVNRNNNNKRSKCNAPFARTTCGRSRPTLTARLCGSPLLASV